MDRHYAMRLLRDAAKNPQLMLERRKFWNVEFFDFYLTRCDEVLFSDPAEGLLFTKFAPALAEKVAAADLGASRPGLLMRAYGFLGGAFRRNSNFELAEEAFKKGLEHEAGAPAIVLADFYRRLAYLRIFQHRPESFQLIGDAIGIHKRGDLIERHGLGECLLCRGHAYFHFNQPGKALEDFTAALNHISIQQDEKPYFAAMHNLATWAVYYGSSEEIRQALHNLKPALSLLNAAPRRHFAKSKLRWLIALLDARLGHFGRAEIALLEIRRGLVRLNLPNEVGMISVDLSRLYLKQNRFARAQAHALETTKIFAKLEVAPWVQDALNILHRVEKLTEERLNQVREQFSVGAQLLPPRAAHADRGPITRERIEEPAQVP